MEIDPQAVKSGFDAFKAVLDTFKSIKEMYNADPAKHEAATIAVTAAEKELKFAEARLAQALGYELCRAHFPPIPMLKNRIDPQSVETIYRCPECATESPSPEYFAKEARRLQTRAVTGRDVARLFNR